MTSRPNMIATVPGIYPPPVPPPVIDWPTITIGNDGNPTPEPSRQPTVTTQSTRPTSSSSASSSSCASSSVVTNTFVSCAFVANQASSSSCSTSTSMITGCSVTGTATTTAAACSIGASADPDWPFSEGEEYPLVGAADVSWTAFDTVIYTDSLSSATASSSVSLSSTTNSSITVGPSTSTTSVGAVMSDADATFISDPPSATSTTLSTLTSSSPTATSGFTPPASTRPSTPTCYGNQVESSCIAGSLPSTAPYSGKKGPSCEKGDGVDSAFPRVNSKQAAQAAAKYCANLVENAVILSANTHSLPSFIVHGAAENNSDIALSVLFDVSACPEDKSLSTLDFSKLGQQGCQMDLFTAISVMCAQDSSWSDYNPQYTLEGGVFASDCGLWAITGRAS